MRANVLRGVVARLATVSSLMVVLCSCQRDPLVGNAQTKAVGQWRVETEVDRVTGIPLGNATATGTSSTASNAYPFPALMQLTCFNKKPIVKFGFEFKVGTDRNSEFSYRFDEKPGRDIDARFVQDARSVIIEGDSTVSQFVADLLTSEQLYIRIRSFNNGRTSAEFKVAGGPEAVRAGFANCPLPGGGPVRRSVPATAHGKDDIVPPV